MASGLLCAETATPIPETTINTYSSERLPSWLKLSGQIRVRTEGRTALGFNQGNNDAYTLVRTRFNVGITPTSWLEFFAQGQDARAPGLNPGQSRTIFYNPADLRQAYVRIGKGPVKLTVGRQLLNYGAQRLLGPLDWTNTSRNWNAIKLELGTADAKVDLFASTVIVPNGYRQIDQPIAGNNIHGAYGSLKKLIPGATFEPYLLWKTGGRSVWTGGFRLAGTLAPNVDYQTELVRQWGTIGSGASKVNQSAYAGYGILGYRLSNVAWTPHFSGEYSYASGDSHPNSGTHTTFDQLLGTNHLFYGLMDNVGWQNINDVRVGLDAAPTKGFTMKVDYHWFWLASASDALYNAAGIPIVRPKAGNTARNVGTELDFQGSWTTTSQWTIGGGVGHLFAGEFLKQNSGGSGQTFPYLFTQYNF